MKAGAGGKTEMIKNSPLSEFFLLIYMLVQML